MRISVTALLVAAIAALLALPGAASASSSACDVVAAPSGNDAAAGTLSEPLRSAEATVEALGGGETACFRAGTYTFTELNVRSEGVILTSYDGERATLKGQLRIERSATGAVIEDLLLNGVNPNDGFSPLIYADDAIVRNNEITNERTTNCLHVARYYDEPAPRNVVVEGNTIHDCGGHDPNHDHGIYVAASRDMTIANNEIYDNADRGIQLWPDAQRTHIYGNVIDGNGQGVAFGGYQGISSSDSLVEHNIITNSNVRHNVESYYPEDTAPGSGNVVRDNCIYGADGWYAGANGSGIQVPEVGFTASNNVLADPQFVDPAANDFRLAANSPCAGILEGASAPAHPQISLDTSKSQVPAGETATLVGTIPSGVRGTVWILVKRHGNWKTAARAKIKGASFTARARISKTTRFKARAAGARDSNQVRVAARTEGKR